MSADSAARLKNLLQKSCGDEGEIPVYPASQKWQVGDWQFSICMTMSGISPLVDLLAERKAFMAHKTLANVQIFRASNEDRPTFIWGLENVTPGVKNEASARNDKALHSTRATLTQQRQSSPQSQSKDTEDRMREIQRHLENGCPPQQDTTQLANPQNLMVDPEINVAQQDSSSRAFNQRTSPAGQHLTVPNASPGGSSQGSSQSSPSSLHPQAAAQQQSSSDTVFLSDLEMAGTTPAASA